MKLFTLCIFAFLLFSCKKTDHFANGNGGGDDTSALGKFTKAAGITDATLKVKLDSLITRAKRHGWWDLCNVIYPLVGGSQSSCKYNLKDPRDSDSAFRLSFNGNTWTFTSVSANPGISGYANTYFNPSTQIADPNSCHLSVYSMDDNAGGNDNTDIGAYDGTSLVGFYLSTRTSWPDNSGKPFAYISGNSFQGTAVNGAGYYMISKTSGTSASLYRGSSEIGTTPTLPGNLPNLNLFLCNQNYSSVAEPYADGFSQRSLSFVTIGSGIDSATLALMYSDIQDFVPGK